MGKIIVAGAGHGGIALASLLAEKGYDVTVYERHTEGTLGYDWTDIFAPGTLACAHIPMPPKDKFSYKKNMTFYSPGLKTPLKQSVDPDKLEIQMERKDIYELFISTAQKNGAKFVYDCNITAPITAGNRVIGIKTSIGDFYGDLIIDACGIDSPLRNSLPEICGIEASVGKNNQFYVYRAFYNKAAEAQDDNLHKLYMYSEGIPGIGWVAVEKDHADLLIGRFEPFDIKEAERTADFYRKTNPALGTQKLRGGQFVKIPVRQPLSSLVCDGYAAIGDSAYMTVPVIGSGISNCLKAAEILADTIEKDIGGAYSAQTLWDYQVEYYKKLGNGFAVLACVKEALCVITPQELDYLFDSGILNASDLSVDSDVSSIGDFLKNNSIEDIKTKLKSIVSNPVLLKKLLKVLGKAAGIISVTAVMPKKYSVSAVKNWVGAYEKAINKNII